MPIPNPPDYNYHVADDSVVIILSSTGDDLVIRSSHTLTDSLDDETYEWLASLQHGISTLLQIKLEYVQDLGEASMLSFFEGAEDVIEELRERGSKEKSKKKTTKGQPVVSIFPEDRTPKGDK